MEECEICSFRELSKISGVSELQLYRLLHGLIYKMQLETLLKLSQTLKVPLSKLISLFTETNIEVETAEVKVVSQNQSTESDESLKEEYQYLRQQMEQQREVLMAEFQQSSINVLEPWLIQWPTAYAMAKKNPKLPALKLLPLVNPVVQLLKNWGLETIGSVGEEIPFNPILHKLSEGAAKDGDRVKVRYIGYRKGEKILYRALVKPLDSDEIMIMKD